MNIKKLLQKNPLFANIQEDYLEQIVNQGKTISLKKNRILFLEQDEGEFFFLLLSGSIKVFKSNQSGQEIIIRIVKEGEIFADAILFDNGKCPGTALALNNSMVFEISKKIIFTLLEDKNFRTKFIKSLIDKIKYLSNRILYLSTYDIEERFTKFILDHYGEKKEYEIPMSKKNIAEAIGCTPEALSRMINSLSRKKIILWEKKKLRVSETFFKMTKKN